jgi:hypothetical protein
MEKPELDLEMPGWLTGRIFFLSLASSLRVTGGYGGSSPAVPGLVYLPLHLGKLRMADDQSGDFLGLIVEPLAQYGDRVRRLAVYMRQLVVLDGDPGLDLRCHGQCFWSLAAQMKGRQEWPSISRCRFGIASWMS